MSSSVTLPTPGTFVAVLNTIRMTAASSQTSGSHASGVPSSSQSRRSSSPGHWSLQSSTVSLSLSVSATPQPQTPGAVLFGSVGQPSKQLGVPSPSLSVSATPQPQAPGAVLFPSAGQPSHASMTPSPSPSGSSLSG